MGGLGGVNPVGGGRGGVPPGPSLGEPPGRGGVSPVPPGKRPGGGGPGRPGGKPGGKPGRGEPPGGNPGGRPGGPGGKPGGGGPGGKPGGGGIMFDSGLNPELDRGLSKLLSGQEWRPQSQSAELADLRWS